MTVRTHTAAQARHELREAAQDLAAHDSARFEKVMRVADAARVAKAAGVPGEEIASEIGIDRTRIYRSPWNVPRGIRGGAA
ncbi:MAG TPA: hypothetical protein VFZ00_28485 [Solirubrobacter sp.]|nr:hypothetical protein [Solirubrobacter sp.]